MSRIGLRATQGYTPLQLAVQWALDAEETYESLGEYETRDEYRDDIRTAVEMSRTWAAVANLVVQTGMDPGTTVDQLAPQHDPLDPEKSP